MGTVCALLQDILYTHIYIYILCPVNFLMPKKYNKNPSEETREDNLCELWPVLDAHDLER